MDYTQASKKRDMANKMVTKYSMKGKPTGYGGGMKPKLHGRNSAHAAEKYPMAGKRETTTKGEKFPMQHEPTNPIGKKFYQQNGPDRHTA